VCWGLVVVAVVVVALVVVAVAAQVLQERRWCSRVSWLPVMVVCALGWAGGWGGLEGLGHWAKLGKCAASLCHAPGKKCCLHLL
jgi:hypothetical protein